VNDLPQTLGHPHLSTLCGPILEVVDGYLYFVHFTAKESVATQRLFNELTDCYRYVLTHKDNFIDFTNAQYSLATTCLRYLSSNILDPFEDDTVIDENIVSGKYCLFSFTSRHWLELVRKCNRESQNRELPEEYLNALLSFVEEVDNPDYEEGSKEAREALDFKVLKDKYPMQYELLNRLTGFHIRDSGQWRIDDGTCMNESAPVG
jgi:hypothetical protein